MRFPHSIGSLQATLLLTFPLLLSVTVANSTNGLKIETTKAVQCDRKTRNGDKIFVHYRGSLTDGTEFDSSYNRGYPLSFTLGRGMVIQGWDLGLLDMCIWEQRRLTIPPELAYGDRAMGMIPAGSTLVFDTELQGIEGVPVGPSPTAAEPSTVATSSVSAEEGTATPTSDPEIVDAEAQGPTDGPPSGEPNGECKLLGPFSLLVQGALGALALLSLVYKRWRERPRRPVKIWIFDVSKQVFGAIILHVVNLLMSMLSSGRFDAAKATTYMATSGGGERQQPNGCSFYLLNLAIDTTIGIPILVFFLRILHALFLLTPLANPPASLSSGNYGHPPKFRWWAKQFLIYCVGLIFMKLCVFLLFQLFPWLGWVGDWALRWTEGDERLQIAFVMFIFPLIMNAAQYWIIDSFIKDRTGEGYEYQEVRTEGEIEEDENEGLIGPGGRRSEGGEGEFVIGDGDVERVRTKEANPTPMPAYQVEGGATSSGGSSRGSDEEDGKKSN